MLRLSLFGQPPGRVVYVHPRQIIATKLEEHCSGRQRGTRVLLSNGRRFVTKTPPEVLREFLPKA